MTATADDLWYFKSWSGDASGTSSSTTVYMDGPKSVTAVFGDVCDEMPEVCAFSREQDQGGEPPAGDRAP